MGPVDATLFFNLRELSQVDLSQNRLSGEVDVLFAPALVQVNFSHNNFASVNSYKRFKRSHETLKVCDLSHNSIQEDASKLLKNMPSNMEQLVLSHNQIQGRIEGSLENHACLRRLDMCTNMLSGEVPD